MSLKEFNDLTEALLSISLSETFTHRITNFAAYEVPFKVLHFDV